MYQDQAFQSLTQRTIMQTIHEDKLMPLFAQITAAVFKRGLEHARQDDPHSYSVAAKWIDKPGCRFELRIDMGRPGEPLTTRGLIVDGNGEALVEVFTVAARVVGNA